jgi:uracil-DNA glycosylase
MMDVRIDSSWRKELEREFEQPYFLKLVDFVKNAYKTTRCYPKGSQIFAAFDQCKFDDVKVVIIGQDPYHGPGQANGLCFSVNDGVPLPPSLKNIFTELSNDLNIDPPQSGNLERWSKQGVLLLNATLTVEHGKPGSHQNQGWEQFTDAVIETISKRKNDVIFLLWGALAQRKGAKIDTNAHYVLHSGHPSPMSANRGLWFGNRHFSKTNQILTQLGKPIIQW